MYLYLSRHGIWYYRKCYQLASGKRREIKKSLGTRDKLEAKLLVAKITSIKHSFKLGQAVSNLITQEVIPPLTDCISSYITQNQHLWQERHKQRIIGVLNQLPHLHLKKADVSKLKSKWLKSKSIATVNKCFGYCSMFYRWLQAEYDGVENRFFGVRIKGHVESSRKPYTPNQLESFYRLATELRGKGMESHFWYLMIGRFTGMRANEVCQLKPSDVDMDLNIFHVRGEKLKTKHSNRIVPVHKRLIELGLYEFIITCKIRLMEHWKPSRRSFADMPTKWYSAYRKRHQLPDYHSLRHTVATELKSAGVPSQFTAAILGHANGNITFDRYGHDIEIKNLKWAIEFIN